MLFEYRIYFQYINWRKSSYTSSWLRQINTYLYNVSNEFICLSLEFQRLGWVFKMSQLLDVICHSKHFNQQLKDFLLEIRNMVLQDSMEPDLFEFFQSNRNVSHGKDNSTLQSLQHWQLVHIRGECKPPKRLSNLASVLFHCQFVDLSRLIHQLQLLCRSLVVF